MTSGWGALGLRRAAALAAVVGMLGALPGSGLAALGPSPSSDHVRSKSSDESVHLYRIVGKVRLLFFWAGADDVGGARITQRGGDRDHVISLLIGSEPRRAPREVNEWGYVREDVTGDSATVFGLRTVTDGDSPEQAEMRRTAPGGLAKFGVLCSTVSPVDVTSRTTTVYIPRDVTYREVGRALDIVEGNARWTRHETPRPSDVPPGFLTALDAMIRSSAASARQADAIATCPRLAYVYKDAVYDLIPRRLERIAQLRTHAGVLRNLLRTEVSLRNRATGWATSFSVTYGTHGVLAGVPVSARYQPNWWFRVELELDDNVDVPPDPVDDPGVSQRVDALCAPPFNR